MLSQGSAGTGADRHIAIAPNAQPPRLQWKPGWRPQIHDTPVSMGYHQERDGWSETTEHPPHLDRMFRRGLRELKPQEVPRMIWEGATLVQSPNAELPSGAIHRSVNVDPAMHASQIHDLLPDREAPLLRRTEPSDSPEPSPILGLPQRLQDLGYVNVLMVEGSALLP